MGCRIIERRAAAVCFQSSPQQLLLGFAVRGREARAGAVLAYTSAPFCSIPKSRGVLELRSQGLALEEKARCELEAVGGQTVLPASFLLVRLPVQLLRALVRAHE